MKRYVCVLAACMLAACASTDTKDGASVEQRTPAQVTQPETAPPPKPAPRPVAKPADSDRFSAAALKDPNSILSKRSVYFDFDSTVVKEEFKPMITAHAKFLTENRGRRITVQGNTDERGSREYNLALGQRRADSVKRMMQLLGVSEAQVETVSFGEEKPRRSGGDEATWAENRRADIVYDGE